MEYKYLSFLSNIGNGYKVVAKFNGKELGDLVLDIDGSYYYVPFHTQGYWSSYWMKEICTKLDELNKL